MTAPTGIETAVPYVGYLRVSTRKQETSGLGLEAQRKAVEDLVRARGGNLIAEFVEVESGKIADRPQLQAAVATARRQRAVLVVARLDRLARSVAFTATLMESSVDFVCCDQPVANKLTLHILAAIAEHERAMISARTKDALKAAKARGVKLGSHRDGHWDGREDLRLHGLEKARLKAITSVKKAGVEHYQDLIPILQELRDKGLGGERIARELDRRCIPPRRGSTWSGTMVRRLLLRFNITVKVERKAHS